MKFTSIVPALSRSRHLSRHHPTPNRLFYTTSTCLYSSAGKKSNKDTGISQGHVASPTNRQKKSVHGQDASAGFAANDPANEHPYDSASPHGVDKPPRAADESGNPERIGFADQVGGQSAYATKLAKGGSGVGAGSAAGAGEELWEEVEDDRSAEEAASPGMYGTVKQALGMETSADDVKQNRGGGGGVTGTGTFTSKSPGERRKLSTLTPGRVAGASERQHTRYRFPAPEGELIVTRASETRFGTTSGHYPHCEYTVVETARTPGINGNTEWPSGQWDNAGVPGTEDSREYMHVDREDPYDPPGAERDLKLRYGGRKWRLEDQVD